MNNKYIYPNDKYRIRVDGDNYRLEMKYFKQNNRGRNGDKNGNFSYKTIGYYNKLEHLVDSLLEMEVKGKLMDELTSLKYHLDVTKEELIQMIKILKT